MELRRRQGLAQHRPRLHRHRPGAERGADRQRQGSRRPAPRWWWSRSPRPRSRSSPTCRPAASWKGSATPSWPPSSRAGSPTGRKSKAPKAAATRRSPASSAKTPRARLPVQELPLRPLQEGPVLHQRRHRRQGELGRAAARRYAGPRAAAKKDSARSSARRAGVASVETVERHRGAIGYARCPRRSAQAADTVILADAEQRSAQGRRSQLRGARIGTVANCAAMSYDVPKIGGVRDVDWSAVFGAKPAAGGLNYPLCALTYVLALHGYQLAGFSPVAGDRPRVTTYTGTSSSTGGQAAVNGGYYERCRARPSQVRRPRRGPQRRRRHQLLVPKNPKK